jgi:hypothetical protein
MESPRVGFFICMGWCETFATKQGPHIAGFSFKELWHVESHLAAVLIPAFPDSPSVPEKKIGP